MNNRTVDVVSEGGEDLGLAIKLTWPNALGGKATHYYVGKLSSKVEYYQDEKGITTHHFTNLVEDEENGISTLVLMWSEAPRAKELPFPLDVVGTTQLVKEWLKGVDYGREPDHDGSNGLGWRIFTQSWCHVAGCSFVIMGVQPAWAMYGK